MLSTACPKPPPREQPIRVPGPTAIRRHRKASRTARAGHVIKVAIKKQDGNQCRWPGCETPQASFWGRLEAAHWKAAGAGGDSQLIRTTVQTMAAICRWHHQGPRGLHSGLARMEPLTELGTRGPVQFSVCAGGEWFVVGTTSPPNEIDGGDTSRRAAGAPRDGGLTVNEC